MKSVHILLFSYCFISSGLAQLAAPTLTYQDSFGRYSFGYSSPYSARSEIRMSNGETRGAYSYIDDAGVIQTVEYVADATHGFRILFTNSVRLMAKLM
ncbi:cuticle protein 6-like [Apis cerana]|uniref:cuticle protein 6-like n=1 Tax=Apis cerana TaxID=7461 RepID=UPI002B234700|nr:cuticle protein 6-like [Apis cerana]